MPLTGHFSCKPPTYQAGGIMAIEFRHDVDNVLREAAEQNKPVLLDFSAAPM